MVENERKSSDGRSGSLGVAGVIVSSGGANWSSETGEGYSSRSDGVAVSPGSSETNTSPDRVVSTEIGRSPNLPATVFAETLHP